ncbi:MAG: hypothetical protein IID38_12635 [Planctomycetes bacterium]|nr:hypothetical protein [Planctomycetota bacterium]
MGKQRKTKKKTRRDVVEIARDVVEQAIGEKLTGEPLDQPEESQEPDTRNPAAVALGKLGGKKGGPARARNLTSAQRSEAARKAAQARWNKQQENT